MCGMLLGTGFFCFGGLACSALSAQQTNPAAAVVVQPGAPGKPSRTLSPSTKGTLPPRSQADVEFMQGMIMHHSQAVEMMALMMRGRRTRSCCCWERASAARSPTR